MEKVPTLDSFEKSAPSILNTQLEQLGATSSLEVLSALDDLPEGPPLQYDGKYDPKANDLGSGPINQLDRAFKG